MSLSYFEESRSTGQFNLLTSFNNYNGSILKFAFSSIVDWITIKTALINNYGILILVRAISKDNSDKL